MRISLTSSKAGNWVDRGEPALPKMLKVLQHFYGRYDAADEPWLMTAAEEALGMVHADSTDIALAGYLKSVAKAHDLEFPPHARITSIALWHIAKAALVRDSAERILNSDLRSRPDQPPPLSEWLSERLLKE